MVEPVRIRDVFRRRVERCFMTDLDEGTTMEFMANPVQLRERYAARYVRLGAPGLSHRRLQFTGSENPVIPLTLYFDQLIQDDQRGTPLLLPGVTSRAETNKLTELEKWRLFLISLTVGRRGEGVLDRSPPPILFVWPGMIEMRVRVMRVSFRHTIFRAGKPRTRAYFAEVLLEEDVLESFFTDDVRRDGTQRPWAARDGAGFFDF